MKILKERSRQARETMFLRNTRLKLFISEDRASLLDIYYQTLAYDLGIKFQARSAFSKGHLESVSVISYVNKNTDTYGKDNIQKAKDLVDSLHTGSLSPERARYIKELNLTGEYKRMSPLGSGNGSSLGEDFNQVWLPCYNQKRKSLARQLKSKFKLKKGFVANLQQIAFDEILALVNSDTKLNEGQRAAVTLLENGINVVFPMFLKDLGVKTNLNLQTLRKRCGSGFNTACQYCGKSLLRNNLKNYCLIRENRPCYLARKNSNSTRIRSDASINSPAKCDNCGVLSAPPLTYKVKGIYRSFCSNKCRHAFRQKILRNNKKLNNLDLNLN